MTANTKKNINIKDEEGKESVPMPMFTKGQILSSVKWADAKDALSVILTEGKKYSADDVNKALETFMKGKVK